MFEISWIKEPNGILKLVALVLSFVVIIISLISGGGFYYGGDPDIICFIAILIIPNSFFVQLYVILGYILDENAGFCFIMEISFDVIHGIASIGLGVYAMINTIGSGDPGTENYPCAVLLVILGVVMLVDGAWYAKLIFF